MKYIDGRAFHCNPKHFQWVRINDKEKMNNFANRGEFMRHILSLHYQLHYDINTDLCMTRLSPKTDLCEYRPSIKFDIYRMNAANYSDVNRFLCESTNTIDCVMCGVVMKLWAQDQPQCGCGSGEFQAMCLGIRHVIQGVAVTPVTSDQSIIFRSYPTKVFNEFTMNSTTGIILCL